jgi:uncharacterized protein with PQ loop repeat
MQVDWYDKFMVAVGVFMSVTVLPQIFTMYNVQSSVGQSPWSPLGLSIGLVFWFIYGWRHKLPTVMITNTVGIVINLIYLATILYYK